MNIASTSLGSRRRLGQVHEEPVYHLGWYPLALSSELKSDAPLGRDFLGGRVVLYRDAAGSPVVQSAYCPHLGADLSVGDVVDGQIRCAFHHWCFDTAGKCVRIPTEGKIPPGARIFTYPSAEAWGLVWAFTGEKPLFELPCVPRAEEGDLIYRTQSNGVVPYEPWLPVTNGLDFQHLRALHDIPIVEPDMIQVREHNIEYTITEPAKQRHGLITGTNTFSLYRNDNGRESFVLFSGTPLRPGETLVFSVVAVRKKHPTVEEERQMAERQLDAIAALTTRLLEEDDRVLTTIRFRQGVLVAADRHLAKFLKYVRDFPRASFIEAC
ncbi:(2Fe-2S)-binding protein [Sorangium cellulosum]|uniref:(2Fe-2S)-binding protein n=1 Tax=Sorangium cellulosum TaxID=56 RepID=A0A2L0EPF4_SORCE|nr:Rieske 2Fe-2S domain-containing protein [Sorangium cellulosum]AUX41166.1 (2Fe-2S)-binding protein [Sorangium cellulosum]